MSSLLLLGSLLTLTPAPQPPPPRAYIVIAAISDYADKEIPSRPHAEEDARALHALLADRRYLGAPRDRMQLLLGKAVTRRALLDSLRWLRDSASADDLVLFAFFGQGVTLDEHGQRIGYLAADSTLAERKRDAVSATDVAEVFDRLESRRVCVLLDVAWNGFRTKRSIALPVFRQAPFREFTGALSTYEYQPLTDRLVVASDMRLGPHLVKALRGAADKGDGVVTSAELEGFLRDRLSEQMESMLTRFSNGGYWGQTHLIHGDGPPFALTVNPAIEAKAAVPEALPHAEAALFVKQLVEIADTVREEHPLSPSLARLLTHGGRGLYQRLREPLPNDLARRLTRGADLTPEELKALLLDVRLRLGRRAELANGKDVMWAAQEMVRSLDRASDYFEREYACIYNPGYVGVGLTLRKSAVTGLLEVVTPTPDGPAYKAGVRTGDVVLAIVQTQTKEGKPLDVPLTDVTGKRSLGDCHRLLTGKHGSRVGLTVQREGDKQPRHIEIVRGSVWAEGILGYRRQRDGSWSYWLDDKKKMAYIRISLFSQSTPEVASAVLKRLSKEGARGLIVDVRFNPGGLLFDASRTAALLHDGGAVKERTFMTAKRADGLLEPLTFQPAAVLPRIPVAVLVNGETASTAELFAACLQDHQQAVIVGERSQGKGCLQGGLPCAGRDLWLTTMILERPSGKPIHAWKRGENGVVPNAGLTVPLTRRQREELEDRLRDSEILPRPDRPLVDPFADFKDLQLEKALHYLHRAAAR